MNGEAQPGGINGRILDCGIGTKLTIEPTQPGDREVHAWVWTDGDERPGFTLDPNTLRDLAFDLYTRADLIQPEAAGNADREWLQSFRGAGKADVGDVRATSVLAYMDRLAHAWRTMRTRADNCDRRIQALASAVHAAIQGAGSMADALHAINALPAVRAAQPAQALGQIPAPRTPA